MSLRSCRLCLDESEDLMDIFHQSWEKNKYQLKIHKLFSLLIKPNDPLSCICVKCVDQIDSFYPFWVQVKQSQVKLCQELAGHEHCSDGVSMDGVKLEPNDNEEMNSEVILRVTDQKNNSDTFKSEGSLKYQAPKMEETNKQHTCQRSQSQLEMKLAPSHIGNSDTSNSQVADSFPEYKRNDSESSSSPHLAVDYLDTDGDLSEVEESYEVPKAKRQKCNKNNTLQTNTNVDFLKFPTEIMKDGKLIIERHQLTEIINQFYNLQCNLCQKKEKFTRVFLLMQHMKEVHKTRGYLTCHCGVRLHYNSAIRFHMVQHLQPSALQCSICEKNFTRPITLVSHMKTHLSPGEKSKWYKCDQCEKGCNSKSELEDHIQSSHVPENNRVIYKCKICEKGYILKGLLYQHTHREHSAPKSSKFLCSECGKTYKNVAALRIHITVNHDNTGKNKIQCKHCGVVCKNIYCFKAHMKKHTGTKFMCDRCPYFTHRSTLLKIHVRVKHTDEKPYSCAECGKCFKHKSQVQNHMPQHTGEAKFACSFCPRMFMSQSNCFTHRKKMHPEEYNNEKSRKLKEKLKGIETQLSTEKVEPEKIYQLAKKYLSKVSKRPTPKVPN